MYIQYFKCENISFRKNYPGGRVALCRAYRCGSQTEQRTFTASLRIRDDDGAVIQAGARVIAGAMDAFHTDEVAACQAGLKAASEKGMARIVVETDSTMLR